MQITVADLKEYLDSYDDDAIVKFNADKYDYGFIVEHDDDEYACPIIVIHPYIPRVMHRTDI